MTVKPLRTTSNTHIYIYIHPDLSPSRSPIQSHHTQLITDLIHSSTIMSWFTRSIANTFQLQDNPQPNKNNDDDDDSPLSPGQGVKEDLSEITKTLTRQFWGVASFLAPPPSESDPVDPEADGDDDDDTEGISGIRRDFAEIGGRFRSGISKLSNNIDVSEITKLATNFLQVSSDGDDEYVLSEEVREIGVTGEVLTFVKDITMHPETWLNFPLPDDEDDSEGKPFIIIEVYVYSSAV